VENQFCNIFLIDSVTKEEQNLFIFNNRPTTNKNEF